MADWKGHPDLQNVPHSESYHTMSDGARMGYWEGALGYLDGACMDATEQTSVYGIGSALGIEHIKRLALPAALYSWRGTRQRPLRHPQCSDDISDAPVPSGDW